MRSPVLFHVLFQPQKFSDCSRIPKDLSIKHSIMYFNLDNSEQTRGHFLCQVPCSGAYRRSRVLVFWVEVETESGSPVALQQSNQVIQLTFQSHLARGRDQMRCSRLEVHSSSPATVESGPRFSRDQMRCSRLEVHPHRSRSEGSITLRPITYRVSKVHGKST